MSVKLEKLESNELSQEFSALEGIILRAFASFPWFETLSDYEARSRISAQETRQGSQITVAKNEAGTIIATAWTDTPSLDQLEIDRGVTLREFAENVMQREKISRLVWERELLVEPKYQKQGIGTELRTYIMQMIDELPGKTLILTRMRNDNIGTIKIANRLGFQRTGIIKPSSQTPDINHEYWYRIGGK